MTLVLLAGPSGAGKTTFLQQMKDGLLPLEVRAELPVCSEDVLVIEVTNKLRNRIRTEGFGSLARSLEPTEVIIVHYDITSIHRFGLNSYESDPGLELIRLGNRLTVISILPEQKRLLSQFDERARMRLAEKGRLHRFWRTRVADPLRRARSAALGRDLLLEHDLYKSNAWVGECYEQWRTYVQQLRTQRHNVNALYLEPCPDTLAINSFRKLHLHESPIRGMDTGA